MANKKLLIPIIRQFEGGWSKHPLDRGGATMCGITFSTFKHWRKKHQQPEPTEEDLKNIGMKEWTDIFTELFWEPCKAALIKNQTIANLLVDFAWASGPVTAIKQTQTALGLTPDGIVGAHTLDALNQSDYTKTIEIITSKRLAFVEEIVKRNPTQSIFLNGWKRRILTIAHP